MDIVRDSVIHTINTKLNRVLKVIQKDIESLKDRIPTASALALKYGYHLFPKEVQNSWIKMTEIERSLFILTALCSELDNTVEKIKYFEGLK